MPPSRHPVPDDQPDPPTGISPLEGDGLEARRAALALVMAGLQRRGGLEEAAGAPAFTALSTRDRSFARALALTTLRRRGPIDRALATRLRKPAPANVAALIELGATQLLFTEVADFAAVDSTVELAERDPQMRHFKGLVNAVLRGFQREPPAISAEAHAPPWLYARWVAAHGEATAQAISARIVEEPPTDLSLKSLINADAIATALEGRVLPSGTVRTGLRGDVAGWPGFETGDWWVQDMAAALPARMLAAQPGERVLDLCAAPGGKTLQLAATGAEVVALDRSASRLRRLKANLRRTDLEAEVVTWEAENWADLRRFDAVLLDAPCSATGTFRRHPDVLWAVRPGDIAKLAVVQSRMLDAAAERVEPGGRLVYCVCSLEPEEGEAQIDAFLARRQDFQIEPAEAPAIGAPEAALSEQGWLRLLPSFQEPAGGMDGFFIARLRRRR